MVEIYHGKIDILLFGHDAARSTFIRAIASTSSSTTLVADYVDLNTNAFLLSVCRVASRSNPADQPFRLDFLRSVYVMQKGLNLSCQRTCRSGESTGALTLEKHDSLSRSSNMDSQHEPIRHHSFEAGIRASISKLPRQCKPGRLKRTLWIAAAAPFVCIHVRIFSKRIETFSSFSVWECLTKQDEGECGITWRVFLLLVYIRLYRCRYINLINLYRILLGNFQHQDLFSLNLDLVYGGIRCHSFEKR